MSLIVKDTIKVHTECGVREIQLCLGDITCLPESEKVDIIMVSSFPGSYAPTPGTVIGALWRKYKLSVNQLSKKKSEDLRKHFHCWTSHELPPHIPYRRLLCFEKSVRETLQGVQLKPFEIVGEVFRALSTTLFNEQDRSVITPLLATGCQNTPKWKMLRAMVNNCVGWMRAGLPLSRMMVVIYQAKPGSSLADDDQRAVDHFNKLKKKIEAEMKHVTFTKEYDLYVSYALSDKDKVNDFIGRLKRKYKHHSADQPQKSGDSSNELKLICNEIDDTEISSGLSDLKSNDDQIETIRQSMLRSSRVLIFLSPGFMQANGGEGIEHYNVALCLSQLTRRDILQPVYLRTIPDLPMYMAMTQWIDCRLKESDTVDLETKIENAVENIRRLLVDKFADDNTSPAKSLSSKSVSHYDVFLSYSHRDSHIANIFLRSIKDLSPSAKIFYDRDEIKSGFSWQATLYTALSNSRVILALISPSYISSLVCREEFAIGLTQHLSKQYSTVLLPVCISEDLINSATDLNQRLDLYSIFSPLPLLVPFLSKADADKLPSKLSSMTMTASACYLAEQITKKVDSLSENRTLVYTPTVEPLEIEHILGKARFRWFSRKIKILEKKKEVYVEIINKNIVSEETNDKADDVGKEQAETSGHIKTSSLSKVVEVKKISISHHDNDKVAAAFLESKIKSYVGDGVEVKRTDHSKEMTGIDIIDQAQVIVCLLNTGYVTTSTTMHHLHLAISKHRQGSAVLCPVILDHLPTKPSFLHLLPSRFAAYDIHTTKLPAKYPFKSTYNPALLKSLTSSITLPESSVSSSQCNDSSMSPNPTKPPRLGRTESIIGLSLHVEVMLNMVARWISDYLITNLEKEHRSPIIRAITDFEKDAFRKPKHFQCKKENFCLFEIPSDFINKFHEKISSPETCPYVLFSDSPVVTRSPHTYSCDHNKGHGNDHASPSSGRQTPETRSASSSISSSNEFQAVSPASTLCLVESDDSLSSSSDDLGYEHMGTSVDRWWEDCPPIKPKQRVLDSQIKLYFTNI